MPATPTGSQVLARTTALAVVLLLAGTATACGGDDDADVGDVLDPAAAAAATGQPRDDAVASDPDDEAISTTAPDTDEAPLDPLTIQGEIIRDYNLENGDCFNRIEDLREGRKVVITARLDCGQPHVYEVFHTFDLDAPHPSIYPGDTAMRDYARRLCYEQFEAFVGEIYEKSVFEIGVFTPDRVSFEDDEARYRGVHCWLHRTDGEPVLGTARGAGE